MVVQHWPVDNNASQCKTWPTPKLFQIWQKKTGKHDWKLPLCKIIYFSGFRHFFSHTNDYIYQSVTSDFANCMLWGDHPEDNTQPWTDFLSKIIKTSFLSTRRFIATGTTCCLTVRINGFNPIEWFFWTIRHNHRNNNIQPYIIYQSINWLINQSKFV